MKSFTLLPCMEGIRIERITSNADSLLLHLVAVAPSAYCPLCGHVSQRVHSHYSRTLADLPWNRVAVRIHLRARKFYCDHPHCPRRIFTEPFPELAARYARKTNRLQEVLYLIGYALGGEAGARVAIGLGLSASPDTLLNQIRTRAPVNSPAVRVVGVDDFAFRRGQCYGTLLVDLERHRLLDLLPDRLATTLAAWLKNHPEVQIVSRDRAECYGEGASLGAPAAVQVADRWHLLKNVTDRLEEVVNQEKAVVKKAAHQAYAPPPLSPPSPTLPQRKRQATLKRRQARLDKHRTIVTKNAHLPVKEQIKIAGICRNTYYNWKRRTTLPQRKPHPRRDRLVDAFIPYLQTRWEAGCHNGARLFAEIKEQGFTGTYGMVSYFLSEWRSQLKQRQAQAPLHTPSPRETVWLLLKPKEKQSPQQQRFTQTLCQLCPRLRQAQELVLNFFRLVRERDVAGLDAWLQAVAQCEIMPLRGCLRGMDRDKAAIVAALSYEWSNGQVEGQVNRLKLVKRSMYGRAKWDLLRARVLPMAQAA